MKRSVKHMTMEEFANIYGVKEKTIIDRHKKKAIPGITLENGGYRVADGTRYPCHKNSISTADRTTRIHSLLKAINKYRYIDAEMLRVEEQSFQLMLEELEENGYIQRNNTGNDYGANGYDCTLRGGEITRMKTAKAIAELAGIFTGAVLNQMPA